ncbi:conserved hypothetical protein [Verticillium alfalfae VaMs.102]|uniref:Uncharacterized protein n=1 Tax=Verticillium alfalfae (strain VaMs.102 / ATCC MYA-4576 / FGSC 10136) TaxID=526221 RepID=C9SBW1_VERA1|nr:conserved hypothetical protein [Verticillium alfalfae VaMs.102]EEY15845.1 conserved hypothetical protein [Verticillium alfalfae VaMs.102]
MTHVSESQEIHKRKRDADDAGSQNNSDRIPQPPPPQSGNSFLINYLTKSSTGRLELIPGDADTFCDVLGLLNSYEGVLNRHESLAANLGAKLTGPRLLRAMEGVFEGPIIASPASPYHHQHAPISWLDIVTFARSNSDKFVLTTNADGERSCQFFLNGSQVQILEDDWRLIVNGTLDRFSIASNAPLEEDETAELATLDIVEKRLQGCTKKHAKCSWKTITEREIAWLEREENNAGDAELEGSGSGSGHATGLKYDASHDEQRHTTDESVGSPPARGESSRPGSRGSQPTIRPPSPTETVEKRAPPNSLPQIRVSVSPSASKPWPADILHRDDHPGPHRDHARLSHMASVATAAADARDGIVRQAPSPTGH